MRLVCLILFLALTAPPASSQVPTDAPWSVRMAESVMARTPTLNHRWHYEVGVMLTAVEQLYERAGDERYFEFIRHNMDEFVAEGGEIRTYKMSDYNLDQINAGKLLFPLYERTGEERYRMAAETLREQLRRHPRTSEGGFWHKKVYPYQLWLDGVYMAGPFLTRYGVSFGDSKAFDDIAHENPSRGSPHARPGDRADVPRLGREARAGVGGFAHRAVGELLGTGDGLVWNGARRRAG